MKKIVTGILVIGAVVALYILVKNGIITWQPLTILFAALAAPFKFVMNLFGGEKAIRERHAEVRKREEIFQQDMETQRGAKQQRIAELEHDITVLDSEIAQIDVHIAGIDDEIGLVDEDIGELDEELASLDEEILALQQKRRALRTENRALSIEERLKEAQQLWGS